MRIEYNIMIIDSYGKLPFLIGKSTANVPFSIAMLNYQRVNFILFFHHGLILEEYFEKNGEEWVNQVTMKFVLYGNLYL